jgi:transposase
MPKPVKLRKLTVEEVAEIHRLAASQAGSFRIMQRARLIAAMLDNPDLSASEAGEQVGFRNHQSAINWVRRFNEKGLAGLLYNHFCQRKPTHNQALRFALINLATQKPDTLGYPY